MSKKKDSLKPWLSRPAINRSVTLPLTRPLTQRLSNLNEFHPNELDPYLLFDARDSMIGTLENPTLDLDPSKPDTLNVITATRLGVATYTDPDGLIATASADTVRVDYTQGAELTPTKFQRVGYTDFSSGWGNVNSTFVDGSGFSGNASKILTGTSHGGSVDSAVVTEDGVSYTGSFYIRRVNGTGNLEFARYGSASSDTTPLFTELVSTDWVRVDLQFLGKSGGGNVYFGVKIQQSGDSVEIAMPQVEEGTTASSFVENTTGSPKFITGATYGPRVPMILVEPSATNFLSHTDFSAGWALRDSATIEQTTESTPMASQTALRLTSTQISSRYQTPSGYTSGTSTASVYIKWDGVDTRFRIERAVPSSRAEFNVTQGGVTHHLNNSDGYSIEEHGDGWWRVSNTMANPTWVQFHADGEDGDGSILIALPQHEAGSIPTSFIPTSGSAVTRAADELVISGSDFDFYNQSEGTIYAETIINPFSHPSGDYLWSINDGGYENRIVSVYDTRLYNYVISSNAINFVNATNLPSLYGIMRSALSYKTNNVIDSLNGVTSTPDTSVTLPSGLNKLNIGQDNTSGSTMTGRIKRLIYWPYHSDSL